MDRKIHRQMLSALKAALDDIADSANIACARYNRSTKKHEFNDTIWRGSMPGSFKVAQKVRRAIANGEAALRS